MIRVPRNLLAALSWFILALGVVFFSATMLNAASVDLVNTDFQDYSAGNLTGQHGWLRDNYTFPVTSTAVVQSGTDKNVLVSRAAYSDARWAVPQAFVSTPFLDINWDMKVAAPTSSGGVGPFFGVEAYDANILPYTLGSLGVDAKTRDVIYQAQGTGFLTATGATVAADTWNNFRILLNYQNHTYSTFLNGRFLSTTGFVDGNTLNYFTDADISTLAADSDDASQAATGSANFDNYLVRTLSYVPGTLWNVDSNGLWPVGSNWWGTTPYPSSSGAGFWNVITQPRTVTLNSGAAVGTLQFYSEIEYTIDGTGTLTLNGAHTLDVIEGAHEISNTIAGTNGLKKTGAGTMTLSGTLAYTGNTEVIGGTLDVTNLNTPANNVTVTGLNSELNASSIVANTLTIGAGAIVTIKPLSGGPLAGGTLTSVPEPSTLVMLMLAGLGLLGYCRRR